MRVPLACETVTLSNSAASDGGQCHAQGTRLLRVTPTPHAIEYAGNAVSAIRTAVVLGQVRLSPGPRGSLLGVAAAEPVTGSPGRCGGVLDEGPLRGRRLLARAGEEKTAPLRRFFGA